MPKRATTTAPADSATRVNCPNWCTETTPHGRDEHMSDDRGVPATGDTALEVTPGGALFPSVVGHLRMTQLDPLDVCVELTFYPELPHPQVVLRLSEAVKLAGMLVRFVSDTDTEGGAL